MRKLQFVKVKLKEWNKEFFGVLKERKKSILSDIANIDVEQEGVLSSELSTQRALRKGELEELVLREEVHWRQKAKQKKKKNLFFGWLSWYSWNYYAFVKFGFIGTIIIVLYGIIFYLISIMLS